MPRIYTSTNDPLDFCQRCWPKTEEDALAYARLGDGPDNRGNCFGYDSEHPDYAEERYTCSKCNRQLTEQDN